MKTLSLKNWLKVFRDSFKKFFSENPFKHSASIAYFTVISLPGIAIISVLVAGSFYEYDAVREELIKQISLLMGQNSADQIEELMGKAYLSSESLVMKIVGGAILFISATTVFVSLQDSLNNIWKIRPKPNKEILKFIINRLLSLAMIVSIGFLVLVSLMIDTVIAILNQTISGYFNGFSYYIIVIANIAISLFIITFIFAAIYKILPDAQIKWKDVWMGAIVTTVFFVAGKYLIGYYLSKSNLGDAYGAAGSLVALLAWVYYSVLIFLFGANFTMVYTRYKGRRIRPSKGAVKIKIQEIESETEEVNQ